MALSARHAREENHGIDQAGQPRDAQALNHNHPQAGSRPGGMIFNGPHEPLVPETAKDAHYQSAKYIEPNQSVENELGDAPEMVNPAFDSMTFHQRRKRPTAGALSVATALYPTQTRMSLGSHAQALSDSLARAGLVPGSAATLMPRTSSPRPNCLSRLTGRQPN
ncbi:hypothetical protein MAA_01186 [Metarhizium robertsii ARSEF 23]|uniref:Uncharacterized protein n=1 Tax=Metarhizium robertsii (strain ARSEF 23 / ATCC MYA-3075) TaxID=655844 RepID=E9EN48_METRA|nr:uncharacterized protein MAA_01186 [Metarhizium robertsii ARSEF 23]EFZ04112.1 hypothetical protein MAA_01186 [Metarhizium robertsii ARSEF 23]